MSMQPSNSYIDKMVPFPSKYKDLGTFLIIYMSFELSKLKRKRNLIVDVVNIAHQLL